MGERKECERLGLRVKKRKNGENHDTEHAGKQPEGMRPVLSWIKTVSMVTHPRSPVG